MGTGLKWCLAAALMSCTQTNISPPAMYGLVDTLCVALCFEGEGRVPERGHGSLSNQATWALWIWRPLWFPLEGCLGLWTGWLIGSVSVFSVFLLYTVRFWFVLLAVFVYVYMVCMDIISGCRFSGLRILSLLFADDVVLLGSWQTFFQLVLGWFAVACEAAVAGKEFLHQVEEFKCLRIVFESGRKIRQDCGDEERPDLI